MAPVFVKFAVFAAFLCLMTFYICLEVVHGCLFGRLSGWLPSITARCTCSERVLLPSRKVPTLQLLRLRSLGRRLIRLLLLRLQRLKRLFRHEIRGASLLLRVALAI